MKRIPRIRHAISSRLRHCTRDEGQSVIFVAVSMVFLAGFLALTLDVGYSYAQRRLMQNSADAATAAAVRTLIVNSPCSGNGCVGLDARVKSTIDTYTQSNHGTIDYAHDPPVYVGSDGSYIATVGAVGVDTPFPSTAAGVVITATTTFPSFFASALGHNTLGANAVGSAVMAMADMPNTMNPEKPNSPGSVPASGGTGTIGDMMPIVIPQQDFACESHNDSIGCTAAGSTDNSYDLWSPHYGQEYNLPSDSKGLVNFNGTTGPRFVAGTPCPDDKTCLGQWSAFGFDGRIGVDDNIPLMSGDKSGYVQDGFIFNCMAQNRSDAGGAYGIFKLAMFDHYDSVTGKIHVSGFVAFKVYCNAIGNSIVGSFVSYVASDSQPIAPATMSSPAGPKAIRFVRPFGGLPSSGQGTPTATATSATTPVGPTATPTATATAMATSTPGGPTATPTATMVATPTPHPNTVLGWLAPFGAVSRTASTFTCRAGWATTGPIIWYDQAATQLTFVVWPDSSSAPTQWDTSVLVNSGGTFQQQLAADGTYTVYAYNTGSNPNKDAEISNFTLTCP